MGDLVNDIQRRHHAKADAYRLLSACFYEPEKAFLEEDVFGQLEQALSVLDAGYADDAQAVGRCFRETGLEDLRIDYTRLFLGPFDIHRLFGFRRRQCQQRPDSLRRGLGIRRRRWKGVRRGR